MRFFARMEIPTPTGIALILLRHCRNGCGRRRNGRAVPLANTNSKLNTEMSSTTETAFYKEPTHDEIALSAFLAWKKDGSPQGADFYYWIEAERQLRIQREKQASAAATQAAKPWPPSARATKAQPTTKSASASKSALAPARERSTTVKVTGRAASRSTRTSAVKATR